MPKPAHSAKTCDEAAKCAADPRMPSADLATPAANDAGSAPIRIRRSRTPTPGPTITEVGTPSFAAWVSALSLGDLEAALRKAVA